MSKQEMEELLSEYGVTYTSALADKLIEVIHEEEQGAKMEVVSAMSDIFSHSTHCKTSNCFKYEHRCDYCFYCCVLDRLEEQKNDSN